jgi:SAM-dependent MidA family methyltransferase
LILLANEVLDCIPARQQQRTADGWAERRVGLDADGALALTLRPGAAPDIPDAPVGAIVEHSPAQAAFAAEVAHRVVEQGGVALLIDYGRTRPEPGDTLQAVRRHAKVDPLATPGEADLTMWAEFDVVADAGRAEGAAVHGPIPQATLLRRLGIEARAAVLSRSRPDQAPVIARQLHRLTAPEQMGTLFKAIAISHPSFPVPPGFEEHP